MTHKERNKKKKLIKIYSILNWIIIIYWFAQLILDLIFCNLTSGLSNTIAICVTISITLPLILMTVFGRQINNCKTSLENYKKFIHEYRARKFFNNCIDGILEGNIIKTFENYNCIPIDHETRMYISLVLGIFLIESDNVDWQKQGTEKIMAIKNLYNIER